MLGHEIHLVGFYFSSMKPINILFAYFFYFYYWTKNVYKLQWILFKIGEKIPPKVYSKLKGGSHKCLTNFWSALATAPTSASAVGKEASNSTELSCFFLFVSNHRTTTSRQATKRKFGMQASCKLLCTNPPNYDQY
jgi:hypothetical protein